MWACVCMCVKACVWVCMHVQVMCVHVCVHVCVQMCVSVWGCARVGVEQIQLEEIVKALLITDYWGSPDSHFHTLLPSTPPGPVCSKGGLDRSFLKRISFVFWNYNSIIPHFLVLFLNHFYTPPHSFSNPWTLFWLIIVKHTHIHIHSS